MAIVVAEPGAIEADAALTALSDGLPDDYYVLPAPVVYGKELGWLVIAPAGIYHLDLRDWRGTVWDRGDTPWLVEDDQGAQSLQPSPLQLFRVAQAALSSFLADELPAFASRLHGMLVLVEGPPEILERRNDGLTVVSLADAIERMQAAPLAIGAGLETPKQRADLAAALDQRRLALRQRASQPFIWSANKHGKARRAVWTIEEALRLLDRHTQAAIQRLQDGTLEQWLDSEGAYWLANLVRQALRKYPADGRAALEWFMLNTGYVRPPTISVKPRQLPMGYVLAGQSVSRMLTIGKRRGPGYAFGQVAPTAPWIKITPETFSGRARLTITADASALAAASEARADLMITAIAENCPLTIPVKVSIRSAPTSFVRLVVRPLLGLLVGAALGGALGLLVTASSAGSAAFTGALPVIPLAMALWGVVGAIRGARQRLAWPNLYALRHWLLIVLAWGLGGGALLLPLSALATRLAPVTWQAQPSPQRWLGSLASWFIFAVIPGTMVAAGLAGGAHEPQPGAHETLTTAQAVGTEHRAMSPIARGGLVTILLIAALLAAPLLPPARTGAQAANAVSLTTRADRLWHTFETQLNGYVDQLYLRYLAEQKPGKTQGLEHVIEWFTGER